MNFFTTGTEGDMDYVKMSAIIFDQQEVYTQYLASYFQTSAISEDQYSTAADYNTDGYTLQFRIRIAGDYLGDNTGTDGGWTVCVTGTADVEVEGEEVDQGATLCQQAVFSAWFDNSDGTDVCDTSFKEGFLGFAHSEDYNVYGTSDLTFTVSTSSVAGINKFHCELTEDSINDPENMTTEATGADFEYTCSRFMPCHSMIDDIRFDSMLEEPMLGYSILGSNGDLTWIAAGDDTYTWTGAFNAVAVAGAAALAALTF